MASLATKQVVKKDSQLALKDGGGFAHCKEGTEKS